MQPQRLLSQREEENLRVAVRTDVQDGPSVPLGPKCISRAAGSGSVFGWMVFWAEPTASTQRFGVVFWAPGTLCSRMPQAMLMPSAFDVDQQPGCMALCLECLRDSLGFSMPDVPPEAGAKTHRTSMLNCELAIFKPWSCGFREERGWRLVLMNECGTSVALWSAAVLIPMLFSLKRPVKFPSCLWRWASLFGTVPGYGGLKETRADWYPQESAQGVT